MEQSTSAINLPPMRPVDNSLGTEQDVELFADLGPLSSSAVAEIELSIDEPDSKAFNAIRFYAVKTDDPSLEHCWDLRLSSEAVAPEDRKSDLDGVAKGFDEVIARVFLEAGHLHIAWAKPEHLTIAQHLRNCVLSVEIGAENWRIPLRQPTEVGPFQLDLTENSTNIDIVGPALPSPDTMFLHVSTVDFPLVKYQLEPENGTIPFGETLRIKLVDWQGEAEVRFRFSGSDDEPRVSITPRYKLDSRWRSFTGGNVMDAIRGLEQALQQNKARLSQAQALCRNLPSQIASAEASASRASGVQQGAATFAALKLKRRLKSAQGTVRRLSRSIPDIQEKLPIMQQLAKLGGKLHQKGSMQFRVYVKTKGGEFDLLRTAYGNAPKADIE